jgi:hypothetical protein
MSENMQEVRAGFHIRQAPAKALEGRARRRDHWASIAGRAGNVSGGVVGAQTFSDAHHEAKDCRARGPTAQNNR